MRVLVTGATGFIGQNLCAALLRQGFSVRILSRTSAEKLKFPYRGLVDVRQWKNPDVDEPSTEYFDNIDAVVHLAGESIADGRWTPEKKKRIRQSRKMGTRNLVRTLLNLKQPPKVFISASAIGIYGHRGDEELTEQASLGKGFLPDTCKEWEEESQALEQTSCRVAKVRVGIVLGSEGGILKSLEPIFSSGLGGSIGGGSQWMSWIHHSDLSKVFIHLLKSSTLSGAFNGVAPHPVSNKDFTKVLARSLHTIALFPVPALALRTVLGEQSVIALDSQHVVPRALQESNFEFRYPTLESAFQEIYSWKRDSSDQLFTSAQWIPKDRSRVFSFFSSEKNLEKITPPWLNFKVLNKSTDHLEKGTRIRYRLKIRGIPAYWESEISDWNPEYSFSDTQIKGPYRKWFHQHFFEDLGGGTLISDRVVYQVPFGKIGKTVVGSWIKKDVTQIFEYRRKKINELNF